MLLKSHRPKEVAKRIDAETDNLTKSKVVDDAVTQANQLLLEASICLAPADQLKFQNRLAPIVFRQLPGLDATHDWWTARENSLTDLGSSQERADQAKQLATRFPDNYPALVALIHELENRGEYQAAEPWLAATKARPDRMPVRDTGTEIPRQFARTELQLELLAGQDRNEERLALVDQWIANEPNEAQAYWQKHQTLVSLGRHDEANALVVGWMDEVRQTAEKHPHADLSPVLLARLNAAIDVLNGVQDKHDGPSRYWQEKSGDPIKLCWQKSYGDLLRSLVTNDVEVDFVRDKTSLVWSNKPEIDRVLRDEFLVQLVAKADQLPLRQLKQLMDINGGAGSFTAWEGGEPSHIQNNDMFRDLNAAYALDNPPPKPEAATTELPLELHKNVNSLTATHGSKSPPN